MSDFLERIARLPPDRLALLAAELKDRLDRAERAAAGRSEPIAIVGIGCRFPGGADDPERYWQLLANGVDAVREVPAERCNLERVYDPNPDAPGKIGTRWGGFLDQVDRFDARFFGIAPREASAIDPQQRLLLEVSWEALEDAGIAADRLAGRAGGVYIGLCNHDYQELMLERPLEKIDGHIASGSAGSMAAGRLSYVLGLQGPALTIDTACSSSLVALHLACESLRGGETEIALAGGVNLILGITTTVGLTKAHMMSPDGRCRAFDEGANGIVRGEGCGVVVLKRLADAVAHGDSIHCVIRATAVNQDGRSSGITAPNGSAQEALMRSTLQRAGLSAQDVDYIETHGTGTRLGDPIEVRAIGAVYGDRSESAPLRIGSVKTNLGHLEAAAGVAGVLKVVLALRHAQLPPHLHLRNRNPLIEWERWPLEIPNRLHDWKPSVAGASRRAAVSSFGFSGTNAHAILEEYRVADASQPNVVSSSAAQLLTLSARTPTALRAVAAAYCETLSRESADARSFADVCATAAEGRARFAYRACAVATTPKEAVAALAAWASERPSAVIDGRSSGQFEPVFLFTGQGSQYADMGRALFDTEPTFRAAIERCDAALRLDPGLLAVLYPSATERAELAGRIDETEYAQPALFAVEYALAELWRSWGIEPAAVAGHSVGEYVAAAVSGVLGVEDALRLVAKRAAAMQRLPAGGAMAAILTDAATVAEALRNRPDVEVAAYNSPSNVVITGNERAIRDALLYFESRRIEARPLRVSRAFHSAALEPMLNEFEAFAATLEFRAPEVPFFSTLSGASADGATLGRAAYWREQTRRPVRFAATLAALHAAGHRVFLEIGPQPTLCGLGLATLDSASATFLPSLKRGAVDRAELLRTLAHLHVRGAEPRWSGVLGGGRHRRAKLPAYPFERVSYWLGWSARAHGRDDDRGETDGPGTETESLTLFDNTLWRRDWKALEEPARARAIMAPAAIRDALEPRVEPLLREHGGNVYREFLPRLNALCVAFIGKALVELGIELRPGARLSAATIEHAGVLPAHARLVSRMLEILKEDGVITRAAAADWQVQQPAQALRDPEELAAAIYADFPPCRAETEFTVRCASRLADVLRGTADAMELLFPAGSLELTEQLYANTPSFRIFNTLVAEAVATAAGEARPGYRTLRVLEVGAGTGGTAGRLLPLLRDKNATYTFTDISSVFLERAREKFRDFGFVDYRSLDVSRDPQAQGFAPNSFDVIVASNVLHAVPDLGAALRHVRTLLAPGGALVMLEGLRPQRFGDLTVGLTPGWWHFTDTATRPDYALLDHERWLDLLGRCGFEGATVLPTPRRGDSGLLGQQGVLLARAPDAGAENRDGITLPTRRWVAFARRDGLSARVAESLAAEGVDMRLVDASADAIDYAAEVAQLAHAGAPYGVIHLLALDEIALPEDTGADALERQRRSADTALQVVQAAVLGGAGAPLVLVTRCAELAGSEGSIDPTGAPLWGLARALAVEHPEVRARCVDLPLDWHGAIPRLAELLSRDDAPAEDALALRRTDARVPRIVAHRPAALREPLRFDSAGSYLVTGGLAGLGLKIAEWLVERGAGRVVLAGRGAPTIEATVAIERMRALGADVRVVQGDVADAASVSAFLAATEGQLKGVLHCAGVTADAVLLRQDWLHLERVMRAKIAGAWNLHRETRELALDHFVLFSTGAAFLGSSGQANHAAANAYLGGLARHRKALGLPALAIDWGAWTEVGAATRGDVIARAEAGGLGALSPDVGLAVLEHLMADDDAPHVAAVAIDWGRFLTKHPRLRERGLFHEVAAKAQRMAPETAHGAAQTGALVRRVRATASGNRRATLFDGLHDAAGHALGMNASEAIDPRVPLTELGLDSLMAVELRNALAAQLELPLPATLLFSYPTLGELTDHLMGELAIDGAPATVPSTASAPDGDRLDAMNEDEMADLLARKLLQS